MPQISHEYRHRSDAEISLRKARRLKKSVERQQARRDALNGALMRGDVQEIKNISRKIQAADLAISKHNPVESLARKDRLSVISRARDGEAWNQARMAVAPCRRDEYARLMVPVSSGARDGAKIVGACPQIQMLMALAPTEKEQTDVAQKAIIDAVLLAGGADRRRRPLHHAVVAGNGVDDLVERALLLMAAAGGDIERDPFIVVEHNGTGSEQGRHAHVAWCGRCDSAHSGAAVAARVWASALGRPEAAQAPSLGTGPAAKRDWEALPQVGSRLAAVFGSGRLGVPAGGDSGGLFLFKGSWGAAAAVGGQKTAKGSIVKGAVAHLFGRD